MVDSELKAFIKGLHPSTTVISIGTATVMGNEVAAVKVRNLYGQEIVWGKFNVVRGKYKGQRMANDANTDGVHYMS